MTVDPRNIIIRDYTYELPEEKIARYPLDERDSSKLLIYRAGNIEQDVFRNLSNHLSNNDILVCNHTRVIRARLIFRKHTGAIIEIFCLEPEQPSDYERNFASREPVEWKCLVGNLKKWKDGRLDMLINHKGITVSFYADLVVKKEKSTIIRFSWDNDQISFSEILEIAGHVPVPPYLKRDEEEVDKLRYQTVYSKVDGSVAAPTAGLHFTTQVLADLNNKGIRTETITLHVGAGTFVPVKTDTAGGHKMHIEHFKVERNMIEAILGKRVISVGTTTLRTLESLYWLGHKISRGKINTGDDIYLEQWYPYDNITNTDYEVYLESIMEYMDNNNLQYIEARTGIIIVPGYSVRIAKGLITNYHMPGSTLLLLVAAFTGDDWKKIYNYSLKNEFRFLSYGDSSLLLP